MIVPLVPPSALDEALDPPARNRLAELTSLVAAHPSHLDRVFPAVAREVGRHEVDVAARPVPVADAARVQLLATAEAQVGATLLDDVRDLYRFGDADEKRAVLLALNGWSDARVAAPDLVEDALRTNDTRLVAAAMGSHADHLDQAAWRHGVLKCLFTGVPVDHVAGLRERADVELGEMAARYAREREAEGRTVPDDVRLVVALCPRRDETEPAPDDPRRT